MSDLQEYIDLEERVQAQISNNFHSKSVEHSLLQSFNSEPLVQNLNPKCQVLWGNEEGHINDKQRVTVALPEAIAGAGDVELDLPKFDPDMPVLRIEPVLNRGIFTFNSLHLLDKNGATILCLDSAQAILNNCKLSNIQATENPDSFVALNNGPSFAFNLAGINGIKNATTLRLKLRLLHSANYDAGLASLTRTVNEQSIALVQQANDLDEYRSDKASLNHVLADMIVHRTSLNEMLEREIHDRKVQVRGLNMKLVDLNNHLVAQIGRNEEMEDFLMMRPSTRIKRFLARNLSRFSGGRLGHEQIEIIEDKTEKQDDPFGLPDNPDLLGQNRDDYQLWISQHDLSNEDIALAKSQIKAFKYKPVFSILVPIYNTDPEYLIPMIRSVQAQIYPHWQLCLVDDASPKGYLKAILEQEAKLDDRISVQINTRNQGISLTTNDAISIATGDFIGLLDHDDELSVDALLENVKAINEFPDVGAAV